MPKFFIVGQIKTEYTFNVELEAKDFDEAEDIAIARAKGLAPGLITIHKDSADIVVDSLSISQEEDDEKTI